MSFSEKRLLKFLPDSMSHVESPLVVWSWNSILLFSNLLGLVCEERIMFYTITFSSFPKPLRNIRWNSDANLTMYYCESSCNPCNSMKEFVSWLKQRSSFLVWLIIFEAVIISLSALDSLLVWMISCLKSKKEYTKVLTPLGRNGKL